jgi:hypothetical protein
VVAFSAFDGFHTHHMRAAVLWIQWRITIVTALSVFVMQLKRIGPLHLLGAVDASHLVSLPYDFRGPRNHPALSRWFEMAGFMNSDGTTVVVVTVASKAMGFAYHLHGSILESM